MPLMAVPMRVTATMPMMTPSAVRADRIRLARIWVIAMREDSLNSFQRRCTLFSILDFRFSIGDVGGALRPDRFDTNPTHPALPGTPLHRGDFDCVGLTPL